MNDNEKGTAPRWMLIKRTSNGNTFDFVYLVQCKMNIILIQLFDGFLVRTNS